MEITLRILCLAAGILFGSFLAAEYVARRLTGRTARDLGSGNPGMANIMATLGKGPGFAVLAGDAAKTVLAVWFCVRYAAPELGRTAVLYAGLGAILGHNWPLWHGFRGGKGVAVTCTWLILYLPVTGILCCIAGGAATILWGYLPVGAVLIPLLAVTLDMLDEKLTKTRRRILAALTTAWGVLFVAVCRAIGAGAGDNTLLQWFDFVADRTDRLPVLGQGAWLAVWRAVIAVGVAVLGVLLVRRRGRRVLAGAALVLCVLCYAGEWRINRWTYEVPAGTAQQASALNDALAELDGKILFIPYGVRQRDSQLIETYVARDVYIVEYETLLQSGALADGVLDLTAEAVGPEYPGRAYTDLDAADWVLAADGVPVDTNALEKSDAVCPAGYVLYKNLDAQCVRFLG